MTKVTQLEPTMKFKRARLKAKLSAEEACFRLHICRKTLWRYESGLATIPPDFIANAAIVYNAPELITWYCLEYCPVGMNHYCPMGKKEKAA